MLRDLGDRRLACDLDLLREAGRTLEKKLCFLNKREVAKTKALYGRFQVVKLPAMVGSGNGAACQGDFKSTLRVRCITSSSEESIGGRFSGTTATVVIF
jgi:hypothetical protein